MKLHFLTIFPTLIEPYFQDSILERAIKKGIIEIKVWNLRDFTTDPHRTTDEKPFGGGPGMVLTIEPIFKCLQTIFGERFYHSLPQLKKEGKMIIMTSPSGKVFEQSVAESHTQYNEIAFICGRYEGIDHRVALHLVHEQFSIGKYVLSGGELPALVMSEAIIRLLPGSLGNVKSLKEESHSGIVTKEYPVFTRPEKFNPMPDINWNVPEVLLSGHHKKIEEWKSQHVIRKR